MKLAIRVENLSKQYRLGERTRGNYKTFREAVVGVAAAPFRRLQRWAKATVDERTNTEETTFWALKDVSFEVQPGEVVGIIGRNGAGKSTLLKILSRITEPTSGQAVVRGQMASLLEVGTGFHPELTGRENIYLNGSILGMPRREINRQFDEIVAFSEIERFLDTPVKRFSSGMYVRLAFAVAAHLHPDILIIDEVLAVGDTQFQKKCLGKMNEVARGGRTVLFVSHHLPAVQGLCTRAVYLKAGRVSGDGRPADILKAYTRDLGGSGTDVDLTAHPGRTPNSIPALKRVRVANALDEQAAVIPMGGTARLDVSFESAVPLTDVVCGVVLTDHLQVPVFGVNNQICPAPRPPADMRRGHVTCWLENLPLMPGRYRVDLYLGSRGVDTDIIHGAAELTVEATDVFGTGRLPPAGAGTIWWPARWDFTRTE